MVLSLLTYKQIDFKDKEEMRKECFAREMIIAYQINQYYVIKVRIKEELQRICYKGLVFFFFSKLFSMSQILISPLLIEADCKRILDYI